MNWTYNIVFLIIFYSINLVDSKKPPQKHNYGPYRLISKAYQRCNVTGRADYKDVNVIDTIKVTKKSRTEEVIAGNITIPINAKFSKVVITNEKLINNKLYVDFKQVSSQPCNNPFFAIIIIKIFKSGLDCIIKKGTYNIDINLNAIAHVYKETEYISYFTTLEFYMKENLVYCVNLHSEAKPV